jgi:hypothetical protein
MNSHFEKTITTDQIAKLARKLCVGSLKETVMEEEYQIPTVTLFCRGVIKEARSRLMKL